MLWPGSECLDPPLSVVSVVVSMIIFQTNLLHTEQTWYFIEKLGKSSTYIIPFSKGKIPFLLGQITYL